MKGGLLFAFICLLWSGLSCSSSTQKDENINKDEEINDGSLLSIDGSARIFTSEEFEWLGETIDGYAHGGGEISWESSGVVYRGDVNHGHITGKGALYADGVLQYKGDFVNGKLEGSGEEYASDGNRQLLYSGQFHEGVWDGEGITYYTDGTINYRGNFKRGEKTGYGTLYNSDGTIYRQGMFNDGIFVNENQYYKLAADIGHEVVEKYFDGGTNENIILFSARISEDRIREEVVFQLSFDGNWNRSNHYVCTIKAFNYGAGIEILEKNSTAQDYLDLKRGFLAGIAVASFFSEMED